MSSFPIVGIGASAGGLYSLECFVAELPKDFGFAVVVVQHVSSKHKSILPELLLAGRPDLEIVEVSDGMTVEKGRVYLSPPGAGIGLRKGIFFLTQAPKEHLHLPIDEFFVSLAEEAGETAIAVIFSGAGTDGARGVKAVKSLGGTVYVQDPATAEFPAMPQASTSAAKVDGILRPGEIAREILKVEDTDAATKRASLITPAEFEAFSRLLYESTGYRFNHYKRSVVSRRIRRRMVLRGAESLRDYLEIVEGNVSEANMLASDLMIGVTSFFRDRLAWKALKIGVVKKLVSEKKESPLRVWAPASATGEEAYSIAMMLHHEFGQAGNKREIQVFATDVNDEALERAREGRYPASIAADVPPDYMQAYFTVSEDGLSVSVSKGIRAHVVFAKQDLLTDPPFSRLDLVICRNFLIYLEPPAQEKCIALFHYALSDGGCLFLGNAESPDRKSGLFKSLGHKKCRVYQKVADRSAQKAVAVPFAPERASSFPQRAAGSEPRHSLTEFIQETLLEKFAPAAVAINQYYDILYHNGPTNRYLSQPRGGPTRNLIELLPESARSRLRGACYRVNRESKPVSFRMSIAGYDRRKRPVTLRISKLKEDIFLVVFGEKALRTGEEAEPVEAEAALDDENAVEQLEGELAATRQDLQNNVEQLRGLNEELQASNEELETSREELQSLNEEMIIVNAQLQSKIEEQEETNNDLNNFLTSTNIPTVFLDNHFKVKRFTPAMSRLLTLIPADVGRPIIEMAQENLGPDLIADSNTVLDHLTTVRKEIEVNGVHYVRAVLPYRTNDNRIKGVVITYTDVTELKRAEERSRHLASFPRLNPSPVLEVDSSGRVIFANPGSQTILETLGLDRGDVQVFLPPDMDGILKTLARKEEATFYREMPVRDKVFSATVHLVPQFDVLRIYANDITERNRSEEALKESEKKYRSLFENMISGFAYHRIILDEHGAPVDYFFLEVNAAFERLTGLKRNDIIGKGVRSVLPGIENDPADWIGLYGRVALTGEEIRFEQYAGPLHRWYSVLAYSPRKEYFATVFEDITDRRLAAEALRVSEEQLKKAQEISHTGSWELDLVNNRLSWSDEVYRIFGLQPQEFGATYEAFLEAVHPDDRAAVDEAYSGSLREERDTYEIEHRVVRKDNGEVRTVHEKCEHFRDDSGKIIRSVGMVHDITERKRAEEELLTLNENLEKLVTERTRLYSVLAKTREAIVRIREPQTLFEEVCRIAVEAGSFKLAWVGLLDSESREVRPVASFGEKAYLEGIRIVAAEVPEGKGPTGRAVSEGHHVINTDFEENTNMLPWRERARLHGLRSSSAFPLYTGGKVVGAFTIYSDKPSFFDREEVSLLLSLAEDISFALDSMETEKKRAAAVEDLRLLNEELELRVKRRTAELEDANSELEAFIYSVSHDLRAPLRTMSGFSKFIMADYSDKLDGQGRDYLTRIHNGAEKMGRLIEDLLHFSQISRRDVMRSKTDMSGIAKAVAAGLLESSPQRNVRVDIEQNLSAFADPSLIEVVLSNLIGNAWKFTARVKDARIEFGKVRRDGKTVYYVRDNGAGFEPEDAAGMFHPFQRLHSEKEFEGTGIGLALAERIVRRHSGRIWAEGEREKGAVVYFTLE